MASTDPVQSPREPSSTALNEFVTWLIPLILVGFALVMVFRLGGTELPLKPVVVVDPAKFDADSVRTAMNGRPSIKAGSFDQECNNCHTLFKTGTKPPADLLQHTDMHHDHGRNNRCLNCHADEDRERLVLHDGSTISFEDTPVLCAKCHGPTYRDWEMGIHGKTLDFWNDRFGEPRKLRCNSCHDPHAPAFDPVEPLPGPNTLRMGEVPENHGPVDIDAHGPLRKSLANGRDDHSSDTNSDPDQDEEHH